MIKHSKKLQIHSIQSFSRQFSELRMMEILISKVEPAKKFQVLATFASHQRGSLMEAKRSFILGFMRKFLLVDETETCGIDR